MVRAVTRLEKAAWVVGLLTVALILWSLITQEPVTNERTVIGKTTYYGENPPRVTVYYSDGTKEVVK